MFAAGKSATSGSPPDPQFNYVTMLLHGDGTNGAQNNTFLDGSTNNFTITRNGNTTQGSFSPYGSNWGNYFDGTSDYFTLGAQAAFSFGTGDFTIEGWFFINVNGTHAIIDFRPTSTNGAYILLAVNTSNQPYLYANSSQVITGSALTLNAWHHFALTRSGTSTKLFIDGTQSGSTYTDSTNYTVGASRPMIGSLGFNPGAGADLNGYLSNLRILKGTALYTSDFTAPTTPLTAITNTSLLTCQSNRFIDNSSNNFTLTVSGTPSVQRFNPFGTSTAYSTSVIGGSGYFDGSGDYLSIADNAAFTLGSNNFSIECWYYPTSSARQNLICQSNSAGNSSSMSFWLEKNASNQLVIFVVGTGVVDYTATSTATVPLNAWSFIQMIRNGNTLYGYINGTQVCSVSVTGVTVQDSSQLVTIGGAYVSNPVTGWLSDVRVLNGTADSTTVPTTPLTAITNTSLLLNMTNAGIYDNAMMNDLETVGNAQVSTSVKKFGTGSMYFDGTGDYLFSSYTPNLNLGSGNFTVEGWVYPNATATQAVISITGSTSSSFAQLQIAIKNDNTWYLLASTSLDAWIDSTTGGSYSPNTWYHVAAVRNGSNFTLYINGTSVLTQTSSGAMYSYGGATRVGANSQNGLAFNGYIDDLRITKGYARYTSNFSVPTAAFPNTGPV